MSDRVMKSRDTGSRIDRTKREHKGLMWEPRKHLLVIHSLRLGESPARGLGRSSR
jgi:hypothetical protein